MTKKIRIITALAVVASLALVFIAQGIAQGPRPGSRRPSFSSIDKNSDGKIVRDEWQGPPDLFDRIDTNGDGSISQDEFNSAAPPQGPHRGGPPFGGPPFGGQLIGALDTDQDSNLSQTEFSQVAQFFDTLDGDKNGALTAQELDRFPQVLGRNDAGSERRGPGHPPNFADLDSNSDGKIVRDEWQGPPDLFDRIDTNGDGVIVESELASLPVRRPHDGASPFGSHLLKFLDTNADDSVSRDEFNQLTGLFSSLDTDQNGFLSLAEVGQLFRSVFEAGK